MVARNRQSLSMCLVERGQVRRLARVCCCVCVPAVHAVGSQKKEATLLNSFSALVR